MTSSAGSPFFASEFEVRASLVILSFFKYKYEIKSTGPSNAAA